MSDAIRVVEDNVEATEAWNGPLFDIWIEYRDIVAEGLREHGEAALAATPPREGDRVLDIGCGLGGATRAIAKTFGTWIVGMEASPALAEAGMECSHRAGLAKKAPVQHFDPATVELPTKKYDAICVRSVFGNLEDKERLLGQVERALRPGGSVLISDFTVREAGLSSAALKAWTTAEDTPPQPCTLQDFQRNCDKLNIDLRVAEDMTAEFRNLVIQGWANLAGMLQGKKVEPGEAAALAKEIKLWQTRLAAIDAGDLRVARLFGLKKSGAWQGS